jgi:hypothetical protein
VPAPNPWPLIRALLLRIEDDGHGASDKQPSQVSIALLGNVAEPVAMMFYRLLADKAGNERFLSEVDLRTSCAGGLHWSKFNPLQHPHCWCNADFGRQIDSRRAAKPQSLRCASDELLLIA